jgi:hypothetical protein
MVRLDRYCSANACVESHDNASTRRVQDRLMLAQTHSPGFLTADRREGVEESVAAGRTQWQSALA